MFRHSVGSIKEADAAMCSLRVSPHASPLYNQERLVVSKFRELVKQALVAVWRVEVEATAAQSVLTLAPTLVPRPPSTPRLKVGWLLW